MRLSVAREALIAKYQARADFANQLIANDVSEFMDHGVGFEEATEVVHSLSITQARRLSVAWNRLLVTLFRGVPR